MLLNIRQVWDKPRRELLRDLAAAEERLSGMRVRVRGEIEGLRRSRPEPPAPAPAPAAAPKPPAHDDFIYEVIVMNYELEEYSCRNSEPLLAL